MIFDRFCNDKRREGFVNRGRARSYRWINRFGSKLKLKNRRELEHSVVHGSRSEELDGMPDVEGKHLSKICEHRPTDGSNTSQRRE